MADRAFPLVALVGLIVAVVGGIVAIFGASTLGLHLVEGGGLLLGVWLIGAFLVVCGAAGM